MFYLPGGGRFEFHIFKNWLNLNFDVLNQSNFPNIFISFASMAEIIVLCQ